MAYAGAHYLQGDPQGVFTHAAQRRVGAEHFLSMMHEPMRAQGRVEVPMQHPMQHPEYDYPGCDILCFRGPPSPGSGAHARNAVVMSNGTLNWKDESTWTGMIDRSPCGTGTCAVMAALHARGELAIGQQFHHESIVGTTFVGELVEPAVVGEGTAGEVRGAVPTVKGSAWITQHATVLCHPTDPFPEGYTVGDIW